MVAVLLMRHICFFCHLVLFLSHGLVVSGAYFLGYIDRSTIIRLRCRCSSACDRSSTFVLFDDSLLLTMLHSMILVVPFPLPLPDLSKRLAFVVTLFIGNDVTYQSNSRFPVLAERPLQSLFTKMEDGVPGNSLTVPPFIVRIFPRCVSFQYDKRVWRFGFI